jgi:hypothetical protein
MPEYHHTVMFYATPFSDFTNWCEFALMLTMPKNPDPLTPTRKKKLGAWIVAKYRGNKTEAARLAGKPPNQVSDLLREKSPRSFGGKLAREFEKKLNMPPHFLDIDDEEIPEIQASDDWPFTRFTRKEFEDLTDLQKLQIEMWIQGCIAGFTGTNNTRARGEKKTRTSRGIP